MLLVINLSPHGLRDMPPGAQLHVSKGAGCTQHVTAIALEQYDEIVDGVLDVLSRGTVVGDPVVAASVIREITDEARAEFEHKIAEEARAGVQRASRAQMLIDEADAAAVARVKRLGARSDG